MSWKHLFGPEAALVCPPQPSWDRPAGPAIAGSASSSLERWIFRTLLARARRRRREKPRPRGGSPGPPHAAGRGSCSVFGLVLAGYVLKSHCSSELAADPAIRRHFAVPVNRLPIQLLPVQVPRHMMNKNDVDVFRAEASAGPRPALTGSCALGAVARPGAAARGPAVAASTQVGCRAFLAN